MLNRLMQMTPTALSGNWRARRHIEDRLAGENAYMAGVTVFADDGAGLVMRESGRLTMAGGQSFEVGRVYRWRFDAPDCIRVLFEDARLFHVFDPTEPGTRIEHQCGDDLYVGHYTLDLGDRWAVDWRVRGPRKDYYMITRYARV